MDDDERLSRLEWTLWGPRGDNGLLSEVRALRETMNQWREDEALKDKEAAAEKKRDLRWRIGTALAIIMAILAAAAIVAQAVG